MFYPLFIWICNICTGRRTLALKADGPQRRQNIITRREKHALFASAYAYKSECSAAGAMLQIQMNSGENIYGGIYLVCYR